MFTECPRWITADPSPAGIASLRGGAAPATEIVAAEFYGGRVMKDGTLYSSAAGWTCAKNATGDYTVTHNLNRAGDHYLVLLTSAQDATGPGTTAPPQTGLVLHVFEQNANDFRVLAVEGASLTQIDAAFNFGVFCL